MAFTPVPQVHTPAPNPSQGNEAFNANTQLFINSLAPAIAGINSAGNQIDQLRDETSAFRNSASTSSGSAQSSAAMAAATANNRGNWSILPATAAAPPYSVNYAGSVYILQRSLTNVRSVTPGTDPNTWFNYSQSSTGLTVIGNQTDQSSGRILNNTGWMGKGRSITLSNTDNILNLTYYSGMSNATYAWFASTAPSGLPFVGHGYAERVMFSPTSEHIEACDGTTGKKFSNTKVFENWLGWKEIGGGGNDGDTTSAMQGFVNLGAMGASGAVNATIDLSAGRYFFINLNDANTTGGFTFTLSNIPESGAVDAVIFVARPARKGTISLPSNAKWANGVVPQLSSTINSIAAIHIWKLPNWTNFIATVNAMELAP